MTQRVATRHGQSAAQFSVRFRLTEILQPGQEALADIIDFSGAADAFQVQPYSDDKILVHATFYRAFGFVGEEGWATYFPDHDTAEDGTQQWEVTSMEGSLLRPGTAAETIAAGATGDVNLGSTTVSAVNHSSDTTIESGDKVLVAYNPHTQQWYAMKTGGESVGKVWHAVAKASIAPGASGNVELPDPTLGAAGVVTATNWSSAIAVVDGDKVIAWQDPTDNLYYFLAAKAGIRFFRGYLTADYLDTATTMTLDGIEALDGGSVPTTPVTVNSFREWGNNNDVAFFAESPGLSGSGYLLIRVQHRESRFFRCTMSADMDSTDGTSTVHDTSPPPFALDGGPVPAFTTIYNTWKKTASNGDLCLIVEDRSFSPVRYVFVTGEGEDTVPREFVGTLNATLTVTTATIAVNLSYAIDGGTTPGASVTAKNLTGFAGASSTLCIVQEDLSADPTEYILRDVLRVAVTIPTDIRYDSASHKWQKKTRAFAMMPNAAESAWTDILTLTGIDVVDDVDWTSPNLRERKRTLYVAEASASGSPATVLAFESRTFVTDVSGGLAIEETKITALVVEPSEGATNNVMNFLPVPLTSDVVDNGDWLDHYYRTVWVAAYSSLSVEHITPIATCDEESEGAALAMAAAAPLAVPQTAVPPEPVPIEFFLPQAALPWL